MQAHAFRLPPGSARCLPLLLLLLSHSILVVSGGGEPASAGDAVNTSAINVEAALQAEVNAGRYLPSSFILGLDNITSTSIFPDDDIASLALGITMLKALQGSRHAVAGTDLAAGWVAQRAAAPSKPTRFTYAMSCAVTTALFDRYNGSWTGVENDVSAFSDQIKAFLRSAVVEFGPSNAFRLQYARLGSLFGVPFVHLAKEDTVGGLLHILGE